MAKSVFLREETQSLDHNDYYRDFPNINVVSYYTDEKLRKKIDNAEKSRDTLALDSLLGKFIHSWGILNFTNDVEYLWKYGQLKEIKKDTAAALFYYSLALKNNSKHYDKIKIHYENLRSPYSNDWVELDYYYRIVAARLKIDTLIPPKGVLLNMGKHINSVFPDYAPFMHPSNSFLIFTSRRSDFAVIGGLDYYQNEDLYYTQQDYLYGGWTQAKTFPDAINSKFNEGSACIDSSGSLLYFTRCNAPDGFGVCDIYVAEYVNGEWTNIKNLGPNVNSKDWDSQPTLSADGKTLFFTSNRSGGFGRTDIYMTRKNDDGTWTPAENLGPIINTIESEVTPFFMGIENTLYFSSTGHIHNVGDFDIFKSRWLGDHWENPKNLGPLVNTVGSEYYFSIDGKGEKLFYALAKKDDPKNFDLYSFPMPMGARPDAITKLRGYLVDSVTQNPLVGIIVAVDVEKGIEIEPKYINKYGYFEFDLINNRKYNLLVIDNNYITIKDDMELDSTGAIFTKGVELHKPIVFESFEFRENSSELNTVIISKLNYLAKYLQDHPELKVTIRGHTDADGDANYNLLLSERRASSIKNWLIENADISSERLVAEGYGESRPVVPNDTEENKARNRRVEFDIEIDPRYRPLITGDHLPESGISWDSDELASSESSDDEEDSDDETKILYDPDFEYVRKEDDIDDDLGEKIVTYDDKKDLEAVENEDDDEEVELVETKAPNPTIIKKPSLADSKPLLADTTKSRKVSVLPPRPEPNKPVSFTRSTGVKESPVVTPTTTTTVTTTPGNATQKTMTPGKPNTPNPSLQPKPTTTTTVNTKPTTTTTVTTKPTTTTTVTTKPTTTTTTTATTKPTNIHSSTLPPDQHLKPNPEKHIIKHHSHDDDDEDFSIDDDIDDSTPIVEDKEPLESVELDDDDILDDDDHHTSKDDDFDDEEDEDIDIDD
ncbi:MAG: OmpA family protein [Bacteroidia bacterium]|nr:OmpA family protein [Bacteroidia bacterium]